MKYIVVLLSVIAFTTGVTRRSRVWSGQSAAPGQFPYVAALIDNIQYCTGVIIAPNWILTAAQCLFDISSDATANVGSDSDQPNGTAYKITHIIANEGYDDWTYQHDIGLIKLNADLVFSDTVQAIEFSDGVAPNATCTVVGWGGVQDGLRYADLTTIDMALCQNIAAGELSSGEYLGNGQLCTLPTEGSCYGDNGSPLVCDGKLAGIVSYSLGILCGNGTPVVQTNITDYLDWILAKIQP